MEQLGYGSENGTWRNFYLTGAHELRHGPVGTSATTASEDLISTLTLDQLFGSLAIRVDGPSSWDADVTVRWRFPDGRDPSTLRLKNGVLTHVRGLGPGAGEPDVEISLDEPSPRALLLGRAALADLVARGRAEVSGDPARLAELTAHLTEPDPDFAIVTP
ncbi:alkyl sulfatase C-terminal domain-containing protein [Streptomyces vinaceus]